MAFLFEKLRVYQKAVDFGDDIVVLTETIPKGLGFIAGQLNRAALSISTNIAEGNGRKSKADREHFFVVSRGSAQECVPLLEILRRRRVLSNSRHDAMKLDLEQICMMMSGLISDSPRRGPKEEQ